MKSKLIWQNIFITLGPLFIGIMNTFLIKEEDIGSWKNYLGYLFLILGIINMVMIIASNLSQKLKEKTRNIIFKIIALIIPFYFIYYWPLHEKPQKNNIKILWRYVIIGFIVYSILICSFIIKNKF